VFLDFVGTIHNFNKDNADTESVRILCGRKAVERCCRRQVAG